MTNSTQKVRGRELLRIILMVPNLDGWKDSGAIK